MRRWFIVERVYSAANAEYDDAIFPLLRDGAMPPQPFILPAGEFFRQRVLVTPFGFHDVEDFDIGTGHASHESPDEEELSG